MKIYKVYAIHADYEDFCENIAGYYIDKELATSICIKLNNALKVKLDKYKKCKKCKDSLQSNNCPDYKMGDYRCINNISFNNMEYNFGELEFKIKEIDIFNEEPKTLKYIIDVLKTDEQYAFITCDKCGEQNYIDYRLDLTNSLLCKRCKNKLI